MLLPDLQPYHTDVLYSACPIRHCLGKCHTLCHKLRTATMPHKAELQCHLLLSPRQDGIPSNTETVTSCFLTLTRFVWLLFTLPTPKHSGPGHTPSLYPDDATSNPGVRNTWATRTQQDTERVPHEVPWWEVWGRPEAFLGTDGLLPIQCTQERASIVLPGPHSHLCGGPSLCTQDHGVSGPEDSGVPCPAPGV